MTGGYQRIVKDFFFLHLVLFFIILYVFIYDTKRIKIKREHEYNNLSTHCHYLKKPMDIKTLLEIKTI